MDARLLLAFTTGMVMTVNPCGFAMLPAYLSFFVGIEDASDDQGPTANVARALLVSAAVTVGFVSTFAVVGLIANLLTENVYDIAGWLGVVIGVLLIAMGLALLVGWEPAFRGPHLERGGNSRAIRSMAVFGVSYAVASIGCSLPIFIGVMSTNFGQSVGHGLSYFLAFALGFGLLITALTVALALAHQSIVRHLRRVLPYVNRIAGGLLVLTGTYIAWYGTFEIRSASGDATVQRVTDWSAEVSNWLDSNHEALAVALLGIVVAALAFVIVNVRAARRESSDVH
jgi:cytochrome c biogenesis protein CcdA